MLAPDHWMPRILVAEALRQHDRCSEAVPEYRAAIALRPQYEFPYTRLSACLIQTRRIAEAQETLRQLYAVNPRSQDAAMGLGVFALMDGRIDESRKYFADVLARDPGRTRANQMLAFIDGKLSAVESERLCRELRQAAGDALNLDACRARPQTDR